MENINLLHDRGNDGEGDATTRHTAPVSFTQPAPTPGDAAPPEKPKGGFLRSVAAAFGIFGGKAKPAMTDDAHHVDGIPKSKPHIMSIELEHPERQKHGNEHKSEEAENTVPTALERLKTADGASDAAHPETNPARADNARSGDDGTSLGVNLVPEELLHGAQRHNQVIVYGLSAGLAVLLVGLVFIGVTLFERNIVRTTEKRQQEIAVIDQNLTTLTPAKQQAVLLDKDLGEIVGLLDGHTYWTKFFSLIEQYTVDTVSYSSVTADLSGRLSLAAQGADFRSVARQLVAFQQATDLVQSVTITSASLVATPTGSAVTFAVSIQFVDTAIRCTATDCPTVGS